MDKKTFLIQAFNLKDYDSKLNKLEEVLGPFSTITDTFIGEMFNQYGNLILSSAFPNASDKVYEDFWNVIFGDEDIEDFYERNAKV